MKFLYQPDVDEGKIYAIMDKNIPNLLLPFVLIMLALGIGACAGGRPLTAQAVGPAPTSAIEEMEPTSAVALPETEPYTNQDGRFQITLPEGWQVVGPEEVQVEDGIAYSLYLLGEQPSKFGGGPGESRIIIADANQLSIARFLEQQCSLCPEQPIEQIGIAGAPAWRTIIGGGSVPIEVEWIFVEHAGKLIGFSIHDPETLVSLDQVVQSIQLW